MENPPKKFFRMTPDKEVRLKGAYIVKCMGCKKDADGNLIDATVNPGLNMYVLEDGTEAELYFPEFFPAPYPPVPAN